MDIAGPELENGEAVGIDPVAQDGQEPVGSVTGVWTAMVMSVWRLAEVLYGPCFAPLGGTWVMMDGNGLMMSCADKPDSEDPVPPTQPTH